jgi:hypothetical protein
MNNVSAISRLVLPSEASWATAASALVRACQPTVGRYRQRRAAGDRLTPARLRQRPAVDCLRVRPGVRPAPGARREAGGHPRPPHALRRGPRRLRDGQRGLRRGTHGHGAGPRPHRAGHGRRRANPPDQRYHPAAVPRRCPGAGVRRLRFRGRGIERYRAARRRRADRRVRHRGRVAGGLLRQRPDRPDADPARGHGPARARPRHREAARPRPGRHRATRPRDRARAAAIHRGRLGRVALVAAGRSRRHPGRVRVAGGASRTRSWTCACSGTGLTASAWP